MSTFHLAFKMFKNLTNSTITFGEELIEMWREMSAVFLRYVIYPLIIEVLKFKVLTAVKMSSGL
jgi:hypothetical protein